jgi:RNA polymerase sigma factor (sigma-70 family)
MPLIPLAKKIARDVSRKYGAGYEQSNDILQFAYVGLCDAASRDDGDSATFQAYAVSRMYGEARDYLYKERRMLGCGITDQLFIDHDADYDSADLCDPESICAARQIIAAIDALPEREQTIIRMIYFDEVSYIDTAAAVGMSEGGMYKLLSRTKNKLRLLYGH